MKRFIWTVVGIIVVSYITARVASAQLEFEDKPNFPPLPPDPGQPPSGMTEANFKGWMDLKVSEHNDAWEKGVDAAGNPSGNGRRWWATKLSEEIRKEAADPNRNEAYMEWLLDEWDEVDTDREWMIVKNEWLNNAGETYAQSNFGKLLAQITSKLPKLDLFIGVVEVVTDIADGKLPVTPDEIVEEMVAEGVSRLSGSTIALVGIYAAAGTGTLIGTTGSAAAIVELADHQARINEIVADWNDVLKGVDVSVPKVYTTTNIQGALDSVYQALLDHEADVESYPGKARHLAELQEIANFLGQANLMPKQPWPIDGDVDGDGQVTMGDFLILQANFGQVSEKADIRSWKKGDISGPTGTGKEHQDGRTDFSDFLDFVEIINGP